MTAKQITKHKLLQVESEHNYFIFLEYITDHCKDASDINNSTSFLTSKSENLHADKKTRGRNLKVEWKYVSMEWVPLKYIKQYNPI